MTTKFELELSFLSLKYYYVQVSSKSDHMGAWSKYEKLFALSLSTKFHQNRFINVDFSILPNMGRGSRGAGAW